MHTDSSDITPATAARYRISAIRCSLLLVSLLTLGYGIVRAYQPLSVFLLAWPSLMLAIAPSVLFASGWRRSSALIILALALVAPTWISWPLCRQYGSHPVWWSCLLRAWCYAGFIAGGVCAAAALYPVGSSCWRGIPAAGLLLLSIILSLPLGSLYLPQLTAADAPRVIALTDRQDLTITLADGARLDARLYLPHGPMRGLAVFSHGFGGWKEGYLNHLRLFPEHGWGVLAYDLRGHGLSSPAAVTYGQREADDLVQVWNRGRALAGNLPMAAYGVSMGSAVTMLAAEHLVGCRMIILESAFADGAQMIDQRIPRWLRVIAEPMARAGVGFSASAIRPALARLPSPDPAMIIGWIADDYVIPAAQSRALANAFPHAATMIMDHGMHLDLILYEPWRMLIGTALERTADTSHN